MKILIVHPEDDTTTFLNQIYAPLKNKTVITGGVTKSALRKLIDVHDQIIMLGHGSQYGLFSVHKFLNTGVYIIDASMVCSLRNKTNSIFIWCNADQFVYCNRLAGLNSGMFISEIEEALYFNFYDLDWNQIEESNDCFASIVSKYISNPLAILYKQLLFEYGKLALTNPIANFNLERLYLSVSNTHQCSHNELHIDY